MSHFIGGLEAWKTITIRVFNVGNDGKTTRKFRAAPGKAYTEAHIDDLLYRVAEDLEKRFPREEFELVKVGPASFNFVWRSTRQAPASQEQASA